MISRIIGSIALVYACLVALDMILGGLLKSVLANTSSSNPFSTDGMANYGIILICLICAGVYLSMRQPKKVKEDKKMNKIFEYTFNINQAMDHLNSSKFYLYQAKDICVSDDLKVKLAKIIGDLEIIMEGLHNEQAETQNTML